MGKPVKVKRISHVQVMKQKYAFNVRDILEATGMSEDEYCSFQFDQAIDFIKLHTFNDDEFANIVIAHADFRIWWLNQWNIRDDSFVSEYFLKMCSNDDNEDFLKKMWEAMHKLEGLKANIPDHIFADAFTQFTDEMNKNKKL